MGHLVKSQINAPLYVFPQTKNNSLHFQNQRYIGIFMSQRERERRECDSERERERHMPAYIGKSDKHAHMPPRTHTHTHTCASDYISTVNRPDQNGKPAKY